MPAYEERGLPLQSRVVLVIESDSSDREMLVSLVQDDYEVMEATGGQEGIEMLGSHHEAPSLILVGLHPSDLSGFEVLRLRQEYERLRAIPAVVITASESLADEIECLKLGATDVIVKPYVAEVLLRRVNNLIRLCESVSINDQLRWNPVTGLAREEFFYRRVDNLLQAYPGCRFDLVCTDIRNFKGVNERYGRDLSDRMLRGLVDGLARVIPNIATSGRVGEDSLAFLFEGEDDDWCGCLDDVVASLQVARLFVRFGIINDVDHGLTASQLCDRAAVAISEIPDATGVGICRYDEALRQRREMEHTLVADIERGLERHEFMIYYQPKHDVATGSVAGAEALVRWLHPTLGFIRPDVFIPLFERNGIVGGLDRYVCEQVCAEIALLKDLELPVVPISINISPLDFEDAHLASTVACIADAHGIDHGLLHLELTETAYADNPETVVAALNELRALGFKIELDDFGKGYSSLALLNILPLDILKIDGSMVQRASNLDDFRIVWSAIQMARLLGLTTVVEGVETETAIDRLSEMGCDLIQGFYYSWPLRQGDFEQYLRDSASS